MSKMPVFTIKAKDRLAIDAVEAYRDLCVRSGLLDQAGEVAKALAEMREWQRQHADQLKDPDHPHVPTEGATR